MVGFNVIGSSGEKLALLRGRSFGIQPLSTAGHLSTARVLLLSLQPSMVLIFLLLLLTEVDFRYSHEQAFNALYYVGVFAALSAPVVAVGLLVCGVLATYAQARVRASAVVYWTWWPFWRFMLCIAAAAAGSWIGNYIWYHQLLPHARMERLQAYGNVDPRAASGKRLMDAGVVAFNASAGVDRTRSGCLKNGATYCVAPIVFGKELVAGLGVGGGPEGTQDLFMSGIDCCDCPGEFRCGDWNVPLPLGGFRVFDATEKSFYLLAAQEWAATHQKSIGQPIFFEWTADPAASFRKLYSKGAQLKVTAILLGPCAFAAAMSLLNGLLALFCHYGLAEPIETPVPLPGLGMALSSRFTPHMHRRQQSAGDGSDDPKYVIL